MFSLLTFARSLLQDVRVLFGVARLSPGLPRGAAMAKLWISIHRCGCDGYLQNNTLCATEPRLQTSQKPHKTLRGRTPTPCPPPAPAAVLQGSVLHPLGLRPWAAPTPAAAALSLMGLIGNLQHNFAAFTVPRRLSWARFLEGSVACYVSPQQCLREVCGSLKPSTWQRAVRGWGKAAGEAGGLGENCFGDIFRS